MRKFIKKKNGSAVVLVVIAIMIITVLGVTVLTMSINNINMASKFKKVTEKYYGLDNACELIVGYVDEKLKESEETAVDFMRNEKYAKDICKDLPPKVVCLDGLYWDENHSFFYKKWNKDVYQASLISIIDENKVKKNIVDDVKYNKLLDDYFQPAFSRAYFNIITAKLKTIEGDAINKIGKINGIKDYRVKIIDNKKYSLVDRYTNWDDYEPVLGDIYVLITVKDNNNKTMNLKLDINPPQYAATDREKYNSVKENDLYKKAITCSGEIKFADSRKFTSVQKMDKADIIGLIGKNEVMVKKNNKDFEILSQEETGITYLNSSIDTISKDEKNPKNPQKPIQNVISIDDKNRQGIIYSESDLVIKGSGNFCGLIISEGNVTIEGDVVINEDNISIKNTVINILKSHKKAVDFFKPGGNGAVLYHENVEVDKNVRARKLELKERYKVSQWKEGQIR